MDPTPFTRRRTLAGASAVIAGLAGCAGGGGGEESLATGTDGAEPTTETATAAAERVRRLVARRDTRRGATGPTRLSPPHGTREFTRSATVPVPDGTACTVVRGHDRTRSYGGQAMLVGVESGGTTPVRQGPDRESVADREC